MRRRNLLLAQGGLTTPQFGFHESYAGHHVDTISNLCLFGINLQAYTGANAMQTC